MFLQVTMHCREADQDEQVVSVGERPCLLETVAGGLELPEVAVRLPQLHQGEPRAAYGDRILQIWHRGSGQSVFECGDAEVQ